MGARVKTGRPRNEDLTRKEWLTWEEQIAASGYQDEFSIIALRMLMMILLNGDLLDYFMEKAHSKAYHRAYKRKMREKRRKMDK